MTKPGSSLADRGIVAQALVASEDRYQSLLASTADYVYLVTIDHGRSVATSHGPGCEAVTGFTSQEFEADASLWYRMIHEEDRPAVLAQVARIVEGDVPRPLEHRILHKNGEVRWIRNVPVPQHDLQGRLVSYHGLISDITQGKRLEEKQRLSEARLQDILDNSPTVVYLKDLRGRYLLVNRRFEALFHLPREKAVGATDHDLFPQEMADTFRANDEKVMAGLVAIEFEEVAPHDDGPHNYISVKFPLVSATGAAYAVCGISTDITDRKRAEEAQRRSYQAQEALNALLSISLHDLSLEETLHQVIDRILAISWLSLEPKAGIFMVEADPFTLILKAQRNLPASLQATCGRVPFGRCLCGRVAASGKMEHADHVDDLHEISYDGIPPHGHHCVPIISAGRVLGVINLYIQENHPREPKADEFLNAVANVVGGIIQRKRAEEQLKQALADLTTAHQELQVTHEELKATELELIQAAKLECIGTLAAGVAHEVKNPLQTMLMGLHYLAHHLPPNDEGTALALQDMRQAVTRANDIVGELLEFSAHTHSETKLEDLNACVEHALDLLHYERMAAQATVVRQLAADLPLVPLNRGKIEQVLVNLFLNALHALSPGGTLTVTTRAVQWSEDLASCDPRFRRFKLGDALAVAEVQDTGTGIPEALLSKVFDPFFTTKPGGHGTGLGLAVVKRIVDLHGGAIDIQNTPPRGVRVTLILKLK